MKSDTKGIFFAKNHEKSVSSFPDNSGEETAVLWGGNDLLVLGLAQESSDRFMFLGRNKLTNSWAHTLTMRLENMASHFS